MATSSKSVLILGCGFGGLWAAQGLRKASAEVTVIDRTNHHLFSLLLYQVATGASRPGRSPRRFATFSPASATPPC